MKIFREQLMDPLNFFQLFSVALWFFDDNFYHPLMTIVLLVFSIFSVAIDRVTTMMNLRTLKLKPQYIYAYRDEKWVKLSSKELRPGDICSIQPSSKTKELPNTITADDEIRLLRAEIPFGDKIPEKMFSKMKQQGNEESKPVLCCDFVILSGSCIVDESILTGESIPLIKDTIYNNIDKSEILDMKSKHKNNILFCGTEVLQSSGIAENQKLPAFIKTQPPNSGAIAYVLRTGFDTEKGKLARTVIFNNENISLKQTEAFVLLSMLLCLSIWTSYNVLINALEDEKRDRQKLFIRCILIITSVVPPELPMIMTIAVNSSVMYLRTKRIFCTEPFRIPFGGKVTVCAFDKTGTLTSDKLEFEGLCLDLGKNEKPSVAGPDNKRQSVLEVDERKERHKRIETLESVVKKNFQTGFVLAGCHSLVMHEGQIMGDSAEKLFFESGLWKFDGANRQAHVCKNGNMKVRIMQSFPFRSDLKRMTTIVKVEGFESQLNGFYIVSKGAPEILSNYFKETPENYQNISSGLMKDGYRVLSLAYRKLEGNEMMEGIERETAETNLTFCGLLILTSPLKSDTLKYITLLRQSEYKNIMITGDNMFTAARTAQLLKMGPEESQKYLFLKSDPNQENKLIWTRYDDTKFELIDSNHKDQNWGDLNIKNLEHLTKEYTLCTEGDAYKIAFNSYSKTDFIKLTSSIIIFARVSPYQKELIVERLKDSGVSVLMCGDGTNDVGGLKKADVGIALVGLKDEPTKAEKLAEKERKQKIMQDAMKARKMPNASKFF